MSDFGLLLAVVAAIYGLESLEWIREDALAFRRRRGGGWRLCNRTLHVPSLRGRVVAGTVLPPLGGVLVCSEWPLRVTPQGFWTASSEYTPFAETRGIRSDGKRLVWNDGASAAFSTRAEAGWAAAFLTRLARAPEPERERLIDAELARRLDATAAAKRLDPLWPLSRGLRIASNLLFACIFIVAPGLAWLFGFRIFLLPVVFAVAGLGIYIAAKYARADRRFSGAGNPERWKGVLTLLLSPAAAMRAGDLLEREAAAEFHPVAIACALDRRVLGPTVAERLLREMAFPIAAPAAPHEAWFSERASAALRNAIRKQWGDPRQMLGAPAPESNAARTYCPRCCAQYLVDTGTCSDCGIELLKLGSPAISRAEPASANPT